MSTPKKPEQTLLQGKTYVPAKHTDVRETWRKFGWEPKNTSSASDINLSLIFQSRRSYT